MLPNPVKTSEANREERANSWGKRAGRPKYIATSAHDGGSLYSASSGIEFPKTTREGQTLVWAQPPILPPWREFLSVGHENESTNDSHRLSLTDMDASPRLP